MAERAARGRGARRTRRAPRQQGPIKETSASKEYREERVQRRKGAEIDREGNGKRDAAANALSQWHPLLRPLLLLQLPPEWQQTLLLRCTPILPLLLLLAFVL